MSETITEMILPGTYIEVRAEGLIGVSGISTGNIGIVGTASKGELNKVSILSSFSEAMELFGEYDGWQDGDSNELTLVRALQQVFNNGGSTVYAVRCAGVGVESASSVLADGTGTVVRVQGKTHGSWANDITIQVKAASTNAFVEKRQQTAGAGGALQNLHGDIATSVRNNIKITRAESGISLRLAMRTTGAPSPGIAVVDGSGVLSFNGDDAPLVDDTVEVSYYVSSSVSRDIEVLYKNQKEVYTVADAIDIKRDINAESALVSVVIEAGADARLPDVMTEPVKFRSGANGEGADATVYKAALALLNESVVNIVLLAGLSFDDAAAPLLAHVEITENNSNDRIAVVGADDDEVASVAANSDEVSDDRVILVAPGIKALDMVLGREVELNAAYAAAAVAGAISSMAVQVSPTNKTLRVVGLTKEYNDGELKKLITGRVMPLRKQAGYRVVKGITTDSGAFRQVSVRRIVDYAKAGTRIGSMPYIGKLNNSRVRGALKATLNGFLSNMVLNEALTEFKLDVTATREQEIVGVAVVIMLLKPTFSIEFVKVIMNLA